jgi:hypothetical protein
LNYVSGQLGVSADTNLSDILTPGGGSGGSGLVDNWSSSSDVGVDGSNTGGIDTTTIGLVGIGLVAIAVVAMS